MSKNNGMVQVEISPELAEFVIRHCENQITQKTSVAFEPQREKFKMLKNATERALR